jgi:hypothetical protein
MLVTKVLFLSIFDSHIQTNYGDRRLAQAFFVAHHYTPERFPNLSQQDKTSTTHFSRPPDDRQYMFEVKLDSPQKAFLS